MAAPITLRLIDPTRAEGEDIGSAIYPLDDDQPSVKMLGNGVALIEHPDGSVDFDENPHADEDDDDSDFYGNLASKIDESGLAGIAQDLLQGIRLDIESRRDWLETRALGIKLLGLRLEEPRGDLGTTSAPLEGMSQIRHPLLLEATVRFQATARGELLPAAGPVKVRNDMPARSDRQQAPMQPMPPPNPMMPSPPMVPPPDGDAAMDDLGAALEKDFNHFLTVTATEYVPDTDRMLFYIGFGGDGFKKVYNDPLKKRPVSESVDAEDMIISNSATDIRNCARVTHRIKMKRSTLRRMQLAGHYRDIDLRSPSPNPEVDAVEQAKADIGGYKPRPMQPKDADYEVYECYCEQDLDQFAPKQFKGQDVPLPYVVTIEKESQQVLAVRRNWSEDDEECLSKQAFVQFPFIRGLGFYGVGLVHLLGNVTMALTALWREMIDNGMFSNFPGFLFAKAAGRQNSNQLRVPPGGGLPVDVPPGMRIQDAFMPLPYKETGAGTVNLAAHIEEVGQRLGQSADINIGEGKQDVPVGTTMALIEQATKIMDSVHKRLHAAQAEEFQLLKERFREDPEAFWRHNKKPARQWQIDDFKRALNERELVPVSDPNNPTSLHRIAKATVIDMLVTKYPLDIDRRQALKRILHTAGIDSDGLINPQAAPPPPDPRMEAIKAKAAAEATANQIEQQKLELEKAKTAGELQDNAAERASKERQRQFEMELENARMRTETVIHAKDMQRDDAQAQHDIAMKRTELQHNIISEHMQNQAELAQGGAVHRAELLRSQQQHAHEMQVEHDKARMQMAVETAKHRQHLEMERQKHEANLENQRKIAEAKAEAIGPSEADRNQREGEAHDQSLQSNEARLKMEGEKHKADLANEKKLTDAKAKALSRPKPSGDKK